MSLEQIVNVVISRETASVSRAGFGTPMILGPNLNSQNRILFFSNLSDVADALVGGSANPEYQAAAAVFGQNPHPVQIAIGQVQGTKTITDNAGTFTAGDIVVTVNGTEITESFATDKDTTMTALAASIQALADVSTAVYSAVGHTIIITPVSTAVLGVSVDVTGITGTMTTTVSATGTETLTDALDAIRTVNDTWYALVITSRTLADQQNVADWTETQTKIFGCASDDTNIINQADGVDTTTIAYYVKTNSLSRTFVFYHQTADGSTSDDYIEAALFGKILPQDPGSYTAMFQTLSLVAVSTLTTTQNVNALAKNANTYEEIGGRNISREGTTGEGEYIDVIIFIDWLQARITENVYSTLVNSQKVPYTDAGIAAIDSQVQRTLQVGQNRGGISPTAYDENDVQIGGFFTTVPLLSAVSAADKAARTLNDMTFTAWLAGAVHAVNITGVVTL